MDVKKYADKITDIAFRYNIESLYAFGSRAEEVKSLLEGDCGCLSGSDTDLDIGVHYIHGTKTSSDDKIKLTQELEELFNVARVDLVDFSDAGPFLALSIIEGELLYCRDDYEQSVFELYVLRRAGDLACFEKERRKNILRG